MAERETKQMTIARRKLKKYMTFNLLSERKLARKLNVNRSALNRWLNGKRIPSPQIQHKLNELCNIQNDWTAWYP